jgi:hypothetical protein
MSEEETPTTINITPGSQRGQLVPLSDTAPERRGYKEAYRVVLPNGRGIGYISFSEYDNAWHIRPDGAEKYPMRPELRDDAAWLLLTFRNKITSRLKP